MCSAIEDIVSGGALNIPDSSLTASGYYIQRSPSCPYDDYSPRRARLNSINIGSTCNNRKIAGSCITGNPRWIQADLGKYIFRKCFCESTIFNDTRKEGMFLSLSTA